VELLPPSVDLTYPDEAGSYTWYWTYSYNITWSAINNNGPDEDLDINIFYVKDVNHDSIIDVGDTTHIIAETTDNDGLFKWTVPSGFLGYIWIHLVAIGPENPMLNSGTVSGKIYDPIPLFIGPEGTDATDLDNLDMTPPKITVQGNNPALVEIGSAYSDLGATVTDNVNDNLGVHSQGEVIDTSVEGTFEVVYTATDSAGNVGTVTRTVIVYDPANGIPELPDNTETTEEVIDEVTAPVENIGGGGSVTEEVVEDIVEEGEPEEEIILGEEIETPVLEDETNTEEVISEDLENPVIEEEIIETEETTEETPEVVVVEEEPEAKEEATVLEEVVLEVVEEAPEETNDVKVVIEQESTPIALPEAETEPVVNNPETIE
jgi:hypothetical protein